jgi:hypothetical protein
MAVALKDMNKKRQEKSQEKNLQLAPKPNKAEKSDYEFPYDDRLTLFTIPENVPRIGHFFESRRGLKK